jgi:two-component system cell cycle response regulator DivK
MDNETRDLDGVRILVVEDDPASARLLVVLLKSAGSDVRVAHSAEEALSILEGFPARVLVVDLMLPRMSGLLLVQRIKAAPSTSGVVVIAVSIVNGPETERLALESGCAAYICKPIDIQTFTETVIAHLKGNA